MILQRADFNTNQMFALLRNFKKDFEASVSVMDCWEVGLFHNYDLAQFREQEERERKRKAEETNQALSRAKAAQKK
jgi:hypothetical protein